MARCAVYQLTDSVYRSSMSTLFHTFVDDCKAYNSGVDELDTMQNSIPAMKAFLNSAAAAKLTLPDKRNILWEDLSLAAKIYKTSHILQISQSGFFL